MYVGRGDTASLVERLVLCVHAAMLPSLHYACILGWEGTGLGARQQGIQEPIKGGDVRDKQDKYKVTGQCQE